MHSVEELSHLLRKNKEYVSLQIANKRAQLDRARQTNAEYETLTVTHTSLKESKEKLNDYLVANKAINKSCIDEKNKYETERIEFINEITTAKVARVFPEKRFKIKIEADLVRTRRAYMKVFNNEGRQMTTELGCGMLLQYMLGHSSTSAILESLGATSLFIDEAFSVSSKKKLEEISKILDDQVQEGFTIILISQDPKLYNTLPRRVFYLDEVSGGVQITEVEDVWREEE